MTSRSTALNTIIEMALAGDRIKIDLVLDKCDSSRSTVKRALGDAEEYGWVRKRSRNSHSWERGEAARQFSNGYDAINFSERDHPTSYFVYNGSRLEREGLTGENILVSAGASWRDSGPGFSMNPPEEREHLLVDSGGYQAAVHFRDQYPYSAKQYHQWAEDIGADVIFGMDWACEDADVLSSNTGGSVAASDILDWQERWKKSITSQVDQYEEHQSENYSHHFVPVIQGQKPSHFEKCAKKLVRAGLPTEAVAIGTVCKRSSTDEIYDVIQAVSDVVEHNNIHLFGATLNVWKDDRFVGEFMSTDSAAWIQHDPESEQFPDSYERAFDAYSLKLRESAVAQQS